MPWKFMKNGKVEKKLSMFRGVDPTLLVRLGSPVFFLFFNFF
jgi:hypothetical protein